jgi:hypothetical protein
MTTTEQHTEQRVEFRLNRELGIEQAWLVGCEVCGDKRTGFTRGLGGGANDLVREHNEQQTERSK